MCFLLQVVFYGAGATMGAKSRACCCCLKGSGIWAAILAVALALGLGIGTVVFGQYTQTLRATDMKQIKEKLSTVFCSGVHLHSWTNANNVNMYKLPHQPRIDPDTRQLYTTQETDTVTGRYYQSYQYYLLEGSIVSLNSSCRTKLEMYVFQGNENFNSFVNNKACDKCYVHHETFQNNTFYELNKSATDDYYFVYVNRNMQQSDQLTVDFFLNRTVYDVRDNIPCLSNCHFDLDLGSEDSIIVQIDPGSRPQSGDNHIYTYCFGRIWLYMVLFVAPALALGFTSCALLCRKHRKMRIATGERQLLHTYPGAVIHPGGGMVYRVPYTAHDDAPPSYVVASGGHPQPTPSKIAPQ
jgi:hypothetical protein